jgi:hypothetical protein
MHSKNIRAYLNSVAGIATLLPQVERLIELRRIYVGLVPHQLLRSSSIVNYKQGNIVIFAENNAVAAKLKLLSPQLVNGFSRCGIEATGIRLEVQPLEHPRMAPTSKQAKLSAGGVGYLQALAQRLPDSTLKQAVSDMATRQNSDGRQNGLLQRGQDPERPKKRK